MSVDIPAHLLGPVVIKERLLEQQTYMINSDKLPLVLKHHYLILRRPSLGVFPIIDCYLSRLRAVFTRNVEYSTSWDVFSLTRARLGDTGLVIDVGV